MFSWRKNFKRNSQKKIETGVVQPGIFKTAHLEKICSRGNDANIFIFFKKSQIENYLKWMLILIIATKTFWNEYILIKSVLSNKI